MLQKLQKGDATDISSSSIGERKFNKARVSKT